jgi:hypothetical protein
MLTEPLGERAFVEGMTMHVVAVAQLIEEAMPYLSKNKVHTGCRWRSPASFAWLCPSCPYRCLLHSSHLDDSAADVQRNGVCCCACSTEASPRLACATLASAAQVTASRRTHSSSALRGKRLS